MAFKSYPLPSITTGLPSNPPVPVTASSTAGSSPVTPLSELSGCSNLTPSSCSASARNYVTYPTGVTPPRQLTPPPTSRFVPLFKSYSKPDNLEETPGSVPVSRGHRSASAILDKSFNPTISRPTPSPLTLAPASVYVEQPPKSAPMRTCHPAPWHTPSQAAGHIEKLNDIIAGLRHQLTLKSFDLETSQAELTRISDAYAILVREKAKITDKYIRVKQRFDELEVQVQADERYIARQVKERADFAYQQARLSQEQDELRQWSEFQSGRYDVREKALQTWEEKLRNRDPVLRPSATEAENRSTAVSDDMKAPDEPISESVIEAVLNRIPPQPTAAEIDESFKKDGFDFATWVRECGMKPPESILVLAPLTWEERVRMNNTTLEALGVLDAKDRSYILQVLYSVARGECPGLHPTIASKDFKEQDYAVLMREQRIDKHIPNLAGIPWPRRLFLDEEDLDTLDIKKAGARGTILTVFAGLRKGNPRPDPRPRRGTKKTRRTRSGYAGSIASAPAEDDSGKEKRTTDMRPQHPPTGRPQPPMSAVPHPHPYPHSRLWYGNRA